MLGCGFVWTRCVIVETTRSESLFRVPPFFWPDYALRVVGDSTVVHIHLCVDQKNRQKWDEIVGDDNVVIGRLRDDTAHRHTSANKHEKQQQQHVDSWWIKVSGEADIFYCDFLAQIHNQLWKSTKEKNKEREKKKERKEEKRKEGKREEEKKKKESFFQKAFSFFFFAVVIT